VTKTDTTTIIKKAKISLNSAFPKSKQKWGDFPSRCCDFGKTMEVLR